MFRRTRLCLESLEPRQVLSVAQPTATEQLFLELMNDARANPAAYGASIAGLRGLRASGFLVTTAACGINVTASYP